ncbi:MAG: ABC transporter ATP-binding protein [Verrucomicrobia bacterium]|nr:MAG: ABC transporter ATP-binding protein [Verrucomicrobiota bacterium]
MPLLEIKNLRLEFGSGENAVRAVDDVSLSIEAGETVCLVGESGSGKSVTALSIARLVPSPPARYVSGEIRLDGRDVLKMSKVELRHIRGGVVSYVFQEPGASLNPVFRVGNQIKETLKLHKPRTPNLSPSDRERVAKPEEGHSRGRTYNEEVIRLLKLVGIPAPELRLKDYPHQLSGGMQQRVMIAMALASQPKLLVADEPTTALDVTIQAQMLDLLRDLKRRLGMSILLITHSLGIVGDIADRVAVMYAGQLVELAPAKELLRRPLHPYTQALINSVPGLGAETQRLRAIPGNVPQLDALPSGCRFHPRCPKAQADCSQKVPGLIEVESNRWVRCPYWK